MQSNAIKTQILRFLPIHHPKKCTNPISLLAADTLGSVYWHTTCMILNNLERQSLFVYVNYMDTVFLIVNTKSLKKAFR